VGSLTLQTTSTINFADMRARVLRAASAGLASSGKIVMDERSKPICPILTGVLRASGHVEAPNTSGSDVTVDLVYDAPYAIYVHEILRNRHAAPTQAKFLEKACLESGPLVRAHIERALAAEFGG
jgi:hypothetical protein